ncbi:MAG TPA: hypothetical protein VGO59_11415 [Verrucomicrobiae bacterium]|jgi:hypothetical protein
MPKPVKAWIIGSALLSAAGWVLSAFKLFNELGYAIALGIAAVGFFWWRRRQPAIGAGIPLEVWARRQRRRFQRVLPFMFAVTAALALLGGALYSPNNYDALWYRLPRMLHWWAASRWHWIVTPWQPMNRSGTGFEWLTAPLLILTHSSRLLFLFSIASFLLLPGLLFQTFTLLGVSRRVAWAWMWLLPMGYCFVMEAGSIGNDLAAVPYALAGIAFFLLARKRQSPADFRLGLLAAGLTTGVKAANLPLLLPLVCAAWPARFLWRRELARNSAAFVLALLVSFLPMAILNQHYAGDWAGDPNNSEKMTIKSPMIGFLGNGIQLTEQTLMPPLFPLSYRVCDDAWSLFPESFRGRLQAGFPDFDWHLRELPQEEAAGLGLGIALAAGAGMVLALRHGKRRFALGIGMVIGLGSWAALAAYSAKIGAPATGRLLAAYYPFLLLPVLLDPTQRDVVRRRWWNRLAVAAGISAIIAVVLTPSRPLWPGKTFFAWLAAKFPDSAEIARAETTYSVYSERSEMLAPLCKYIPSEARTVGLYDLDNASEVSLWHPFGSRKVVRVTGPAGRWKPSLEWLVVDNASVKWPSGDSFNQWLSKNGGTIVGQESITAKVGGGPQQWSVVHFNPRFAP